MEQRWPLDPEMNIIHTAPKNLGGLPIINNIVNTWVRHNAVARAAHVNIDPLIVFWDHERYIVVVDSNVVADLSWDTLVMNVHREFPGELGEKVFTMPLPSWDPVPGLAGKYRFELKTGSEEPLLVSDILKRLERILA